MMKKALKRIGHGLLFGIGSQQAETNSAFIGQVANDGKGTWANVEIVAELFDRDGEFLDKCSSYLDGSIEPGETRNFKDSCPNCPDNPGPAYDSYTLTMATRSLP